MAENNKGSTGNWGHASPIDIDAFLKDIKAYRARLEMVMEDGRDPSNIIVHEKMVDSFLVVENERARSNPSRPDLNSYYFLDTKDMLRYMQQQKNVTEADRIPQWRAIAK